MVDEKKKEEDRPNVKLTGQDGNAFAIMGACRKASKRAGWPNERWEGVQAEMMSGDYNHLLATAMKHFNVE